MIHGKLTCKHGREDVLNCARCAQARWEKLEAENRRLKEYVQRMEPTICWGVECVHEAKALDMCLLQQHRLDTSSRFARFWKKLARRKKRQLEIALEELKILAAHLECPGCTRSRSSCVTCQRVSGFDPCMSCMASDALDRIEKAGRD